MDEINLPQYPITRKLALECGSLYYQTGKMCPKGHNSVRMVSNRTCVECVKSWKDANSIRMKISSSLYRERNRQRIVTYNSEWQKKNKKSRRISCLRWRTLYPEKQAASNRSWQHNNKERSKYLAKRWIAANPQKWTIIQSVRRSRINNAAGHHSLDEIKDILRRQKYLCANPFCSVDLRSTTKSLDHKIPLKCGGSNYAQNLQWLCRSCNSSKGTKSMETWLHMQELKHA